MANEHSNLDLFDCGGNRRQIPMHNPTNLTSANARATQRTARDTQTRNHRSFRLTLALVKDGDALSAGPREVMVQGEDLGVWIAGQKAAREVLQPAQR
ncbi:hypothetical protein [Streptomyces sindenensis]|uniref:Uncharacterized protein n=1 Tax=Streptomyces sindenensis TaxID=67363 RepID=A0ABW6EBH8_9ACTN